MIKERPGEPDDRDIVVSSLDCDRFGRDLDAYRDNYEKIDMSKEDWRVGKVEDKSIFTGEIGTIKHSIRHYNSTELSPKVQRLANEEFTEANEYYRELRKKY